MKPRVVVAVSLDTLNDGSRSDSSTPLTRVTDAHKRRRFEHVGSAPADARVFACGDKKATCTIFLLSLAVARRAAKLCASKYGAEADSSVYFRPRFSKPTSFLVIQKRAASAFILFPHKFSLLFITCLISLLFFLSHVRSRIRNSSPAPISCAQSLTLPHHVSAKKQLTPCVEHVLLHLPHPLRTHAVVNGSEG